LVEQWTVMHLKHYKR